MKRVLLEPDPMRRYERIAVWMVALGFLLLCLGLAIKALWSL